MLISKRHQIRQQWLSIWDKLFSFLKYALSEPAQGLWTRSMKNTSSYYTISFNQVQHHIYAIRCPQCIGWIYRHSHPCISRHPSPKTSQAMHDVWLFSRYESLHESRTSYRFNKLWRYQGMNLVLPWAPCNRGQTGTHSNCCIGETTMSPLTGTARLAAMSSANNSSRWSILSGLWKVSGRKKEYDGSNGSKTKSRNRKGLLIWLSLEGVYLHQQRVMKVPDVVMKRRVVYVDKWSPDVR